MDATVQKYQRTRALSRPVVWNRPPEVPARCVVVIPACEESHDLPETLRQLAACREPPAIPRQRICVLVVINNPPAEPGQPDRMRMLRDNQETLRWLQNETPALPLTIGWIDASSPGCELPGRGGVGQARRIGGDTALEFLVAPDAPPGVLLHLDADTLPEPTYFEAAEELLASGCGGGTILFEHLPAPTPAAQFAIDSYELYLHFYVLGLKTAGSPYAFHTVGSTMACTTGAYAGIGGMPRKRLAGEDFYFMQNLARTAGVTTLRSTVVHPSPRPSRRVPFGTGPRIAAFLDGEQPEFTVQAPENFTLLRRTREAFSRVLAGDLPLDSSPFADLETQIQNFFLEAGIRDVLPKFQRQFRTAKARMRAFDTWFDGLATFRLIRRLSETLHPPVPLMDGWRAMLAAIGLALPADSPAELLRAWRKRLRQGGTTDNIDDSPYEEEKR